MAYIPAVNCVRVSLEMKWDAQVVVNTLHFVKGSAVVVADLALVATAAQNWWNSYARPNVSDTLSLQAVNVIDLTTSSSPSLNQPVSPALVGANATQTMPSNVTAVISWRTAFRGRSARGRYYWPGLVSNQVFNNVEITSAAQLFMTVAAANISGFFSPLGFTQAVVSYYANKLPRATALIQPITSAVVDVFVDSMRRRLAGRGV